MEERPFTLEESENETFGYSADDTCTLYPTKIFVLVFG